MDPLSISVSALTLLQVAASITKTLRGFKHSIKNIDTRIEGLCGELDRLTACLKTVQETLDTCQQLDLASVGETLWQQCDVAISDCNMTLSAMSIMAEKIGSTAKRRGFIGKTKAVVDWNEHSADLAAFRDKIHKSYLALQTMLQTITVSTSLRSQDSLELVHLKLDVLKRSIEDALGATLRPAGGFSYSDSDLRLTHNLRKLLDSAKQFHSAASSTASTIRDGTGGPWMAHGDQAMSLMGDFPPTRRQWVEDYVQAGRQQRHQSPDSSGQRTPHRAVSPRRPRSPTGSHCAVPFAAIDSITARTSDPVVPVEEDHGPSEDKQEEDENGDDDNDNYSDNAEAEAEAERAFQDRVHELAMDRIRIQDYGNAAIFLQRALKLVPSTGSTKAERRRLQIQLAVCHFLQGHWKKAEALVSALLKTKNIRDSVICTLLHALSLAHLFHYSFDRALNIGQKALQGRKRLLKMGSIDSSEVDETRALLATIYDVRGGNDDYIRADVFSGQLADGFKYNHPTSETAFIKDHPTLLPIVFGDGNLGSRLTTHVELPGDTDLGINSPKVARRPTINTLRRRPTVAGGVSPLSVKLTDHWRYEQDTNKFAISEPMPASRPLSPEADTDADDEISPVVDTPSLPIRNRLTRLLTIKRSKSVRLEDAPGAVPDATEPPTAMTASPTSRWLRSGGAFGLTKSKGLLRKKPGEDILKRPRRPKSLGILGRMSAPQTETTDPVENGSKIMDWLRYQPPSKDDEDCASVAAHVGSLRGPSPEPSWDYFHPDSLSDQFVPPFASFDEAAAYSQYMSSVAHIHPHVPDDKATTVQFNRNAGISGTGDGLCHELMDTSPRQKLLNLPLARERISIPGSAIFSSASFKSRTPHLTLQLPGLRNTAAIENVPGQLAKLFIAIPTMTDQNECRAAISSLRELLPYVWNDPVLACDMRRIINMLEDSGSTGTDDASDSGYETMTTTESPKSPSGPNSEAEPEHDSVPPLAFLEPASPKVEHGRLPMNQPVSPVLRRAFSFVVGAEDILTWRRPGDTEEGDNDEPARSSKKQVSFVLNPEPRNNSHTSDPIQSESGGKKKSDKISSCSIEASSIEREGRKLPKDWRQRSIGGHKNISGKVS